MSILSCFRTLSPSTFILAFLSLGLLRSTCGLLPLVTFQLAYGAQG